MDKDLSRPLNRSQNLSLVGICFYMAYLMIIGSPALTGLIRSLGADDLVYSIIMAMPVIGGIVQVFTTYLLEYYGKRKPFILIFGYLQRLLWIPIALIPLFFGHGNVKSIIWVIAILLTASFALNSVVQTVYISWIGASVPLHIRGKYYSRRMMLCAVVGAVVLLAVGKILDIFPGFIGYAIVFLCAAFLGAVDTSCFIWIEDPPMLKEKERQSFLKLFFEPFKNKNYSRYVLFITVWVFGYSFSLPFINIYMMENLKISFFMISILAQVTSTLSTILFARFWGKLVDKFSNKLALVLGCWGIALSPIIWFFVTPQNYMLIAVIYFLSGMFFPGYELASVNFSISLAPEKNRMTYISNFALVTSIFGSAASYICGGILMKVSKSHLENFKIPFFLGQKFNHFHLLFIISCLIMMGANIFLLKRIKEENTISFSEVIHEVLKNKIS